MFFSLPTYQLIAYALVGLVMIIFAFTVGFDLGTGIVLPFVGKTNEERRVLINSVGPTWDGNQVWLIILGTLIFALWPYGYALSFSGFYGGMFLLLWALFLRPVAFEYRSKINSDRWRKTWDLCLFLGSLVPALAVGVVIGNMMKGVPFYYQNDYPFYTGHFWQLFNPFGLLVGVATVLLVISHGCCYLRLRTTDAINDRCRKAARYSSLIFILGFAAAGFWVAHMTGYQLVKSAPLGNLTANVVKEVPAGLLHNYSKHAWTIFAPIAGFVGAILVFLLSFSKRAAGLSFWSSSLAAIGTILTFGFSFFPFVMISNTNPNMSLTVWNSSATQYAIQTIFIVAIIFIPTIGLYTSWVYRKLWGKLTVEKIKKEDHQLY